MLKNRLELAKYFAELGFKSGAEIGVAEGRYSEILCQNIPSLELIAIDTWDNYRTDRRAAGSHQTGEELTKERLSPYKATIVKKASMDAVKDIADESLDFVYIDADHSYQAVKDDIREWAKKVRKGGIVSGHDYYIFPNSGNKDVINAVDEYVKENGLTLQTTDWDENYQRWDELQPSWYFFN
mgnify:CR=1 FL=1